MVRAKHKELGWVRLETRTDGYYFDDKKVAGVFGTDLDDDFYRLEFII